MASTVAETLAERFWQQVMKRNKKTRCFKGKLHWEMCSAQLLCERGSFHIQQHLGPLPELQGEGRCSSPGLRAAGEEWPALETGETCSSRISTGASVWPGSEVSPAVSVVWGFLMMVFGTEQHPRDRVFCKVGLLWAPCAAEPGWDEVCCLEMRG